MLLFTRPSSVAKLRKIVNNTTGMSLFNQLIENERTSGFGAIGIFDSRNVFSNIQTFTGHKILPMNETSHSPRNSPL